MPDTPRTTAAFLDASTGLFKDNTAGDIGANDLRDFTLSSYQPQGICDFRMGLEEAVPVSTTDQTSKSVIYFNAVGRGNRLGLSDGTYWLQATPQPFALAGLTGLTSARNYDVFAAYSTPTHSSTNTGTDIVTWSSNPGWTTGTYVLCLSTGSGLTAGTHYWYNRASSTTGSFHTTLANAVAGTSKVDLTGNVTNTLVGFFADLGPTWNTGSGSDTARGTGAGSTALTTLSGTYVNSVSVTGSIGAGTIAASAGTYLGTVRTTGTTTVESSQVNRFLWNATNQTLVSARVHEGTSHTYNSSTVRDWRANTSSYCYCVVGLQLNCIVNLFGRAQPSTSGCNAVLYVYQDGALPDDAGLLQWHNGTMAFTQTSSFPKLIGAGYHYTYAREVDFSNNSTTFEQCRISVNYMG